MNLQSQLESLLFVAGDNGLRLEEIMRLLGVYEPKALYLLAVLKIKHDNDPTSGLQLQQFGHKYQLVTKAFNQEIIERYAQSPFANKLTQAGLETLAIIAYQQPITRLQIDEIRGVQSQAMLQKLMRYDLIEEIGRQDSPGRPILYGLTDYFYQYFGLATLADLPSIDFDFQSVNQKKDDGQLFASPS